MGKAAQAMAVVLLVEDEPIIRWLGVEMLQEGGYQVLEASNADEAIAILDHTPAVGLIFSDIDLPGNMDGLALVGLVRDRWPNIHLLLTSGRDEPDPGSMPENCKFLTKPYSSGQMLEVVDALLSRQ